MVSKQTHPHVMHNNNNTIHVIVQYPMQFSGPQLLEVLITHVEHRFAQANGRSTNTFRFGFHALLLCIYYAVRNNTE